MSLKREKKKAAPVFGVALVKLGWIAGFGQNGRGFRDR